MIRWLLDLDRLDPSDPSVRLEWAAAVPAWGWAMIVLGAVALAWLAYRGLASPRPARALLGVSRALLVLLIAVLIAGPQLVRPNERSEPDWVILLADRSSSMTIADGPDGEPRDRALARAVDAAQPALRSIAESRRLLALGFDGGVFSIDPLADDAGAIDDLLGEPDGRRTFLGASLDLALDQAAARPVAGVVILSDGASSDEVSRRALRRLRAERIPVYALPLGAAEPAVDVGLAQVDAPRAGFVGDRVPVTVSLARSGPTAEGGGWLELIDDRTDRVLDRQRVEAEGGEPGDITLVATPAEAGEASWRVRYSPDGADLLADNNAAALTIELVDRPVRVLQLDGYPRWEFRYLKNLVLRESSIASTSLLLATGRRHIQEGDLFIERLPSSPGEWEPFDVVVLGDLRAELLSEEQLRQLHDHVADRGAGLLWIAGPGATPGSWRGTPVEPLLPITLAAGVGEWPEPVTMSRDAEADRFGLLELDDRTDGGWPERLSQPETGWSLLRWAQRFDRAQLKPTARPLAWFNASSDPDSRSPAVITMRYGAGRVIYVATDEIWRWRYARGEELTERFWIPLIRLLGREGLARAGRDAMLRVSPRTAPMGVPITLELELLDSRLVDASPSAIRVRAEDRDGPLGEAIELLSEPSDASGRRFAAIWTPPGIGSYRLVADDPLFAGVGPDAMLEVFARDDERRRPETDHALLADLAEQTGGAVLTEEELASLADRLPNRARRITGTPEIETLWDTPLTLLLIVVLLSVEWIGRRLIRLS